MRIKLCDTWDSPILPPIEGGPRRWHFVGRRDQVQHLANELIRREMGSILIAGHRGAGKTSLVYEALHRFLAEVKQQSAIIVLLNGPQLFTSPVGSESQDSAFRKQFIENVIRRLYASTKGKQLSTLVSGEIEKLYLKIAATTARQTELRKTEAVRAQESMVEQSTDVGAGVRIIVCIILVILGLSGCALQLLPSLVPSGMKLLPLLLTLPAPISTILVLRWKYSRSARRNSSTSAEVLYQFDNSISNIAFDLEQLHAIIHNAGIRLIYVIDELDKLDADGLHEAVESFKNLFTLSWATFIFVADEKAYGTKRLNPDDLFERQSDYTFFNSRYFISRATYSELREFFSRIIVEQEGPEGDLELLIRSICFAARNDLFDIRAAISSRITSFEGRCPIIEIEDLSIRDIEFGRMHKAITILFEDRYMSRSITKCNENEQMLRELFGRAVKLLGVGPIKPLEDPTQLTAVDQLVRDFHSLLVRVGALRTTGHVQPGKSNELRIELRRLEYTGTIPETPPDRLSNLTEYEYEFLSQFDIFVKYVLACVNACRSRNNTSLLSPDECISASEELVTHGLNVTKHMKVGKERVTVLGSRDGVPGLIRDDIEKYLEETREFINSVRRTLPTVISRMIVSMYKEFEMEVVLTGYTDALKPGGDMLRHLLQINNGSVARVRGGREIGVVYGAAAELLRWGGSITKRLDTIRIVVVSSDASIIPKLRAAGFWVVDDSDPERVFTTVGEVLDAAGSFLHQRDGDGD